MSTNITNIETLKSKLRKIYDRAQRGGTPAEAETASKILDNLLKEYDLTLDDVIEQTKTWRKYHWRTKHEQKLMIQVVSKIRNTTKVVYKQRGSYLYFELSELDAKDFQLMLAQYKRALNDELDRAVSAFIHANKIFGTAHVRPEDEFSQEELEKMREIQNRARAIKPTPIKRRDRVLGNGEAS
jgi:hypothetical protein